MKTQKLIKITKTILLAVILLLLGYDILIACLRQWSATISKQTLLASERFIALPLMWGILGSHFFCSKIGKKLFGRIPRLRYLVWIPQAAAVLILSIVGCFKDIPALIWIGDNLYIPLFYGIFLGLAWWQEKDKL